MREIKFRAWCPQDRDDLGYMYLPSGSIDVECGVLVKRKHYVREIMLQFTGLHDKNGKEIYEGDVVKIQAFSDTPHEIVFDRGAFCIIGNTGMDADIKYAEDERSEIIGNIYENPELLK